jgi:hypothetical protein
MEPSGSEVGCFPTFSHQNSASISHLLPFMLQLQLACFINLHLHFPTSKPYTLKRAEILFVTQQDMIITVTVTNHKLVLGIWLGCCVHSYMGAKMWTEISVHPGKKRLTTYDPYTFKLHLLALYTANCSLLSHFNITDFECLKYLTFIFHWIHVILRTLVTLIHKEILNCARGPNPLLPSLLIQHIHNYLPYTEDERPTVSVKEALWVKNYVASASASWNGS